MIIARQLLGKAPRCDCPGPGTTIMAAGGASVVWLGASYGTSWVYGKLAGPVTTRRSVATLGAVHLGLGIVLSAIMLLLRPALGGKVAVPGAAVLAAQGITSAIGYFTLAAGMPPTPAAAAEEQAA
jgi:hypothetical protein